MLSVKVNSFWLKVLKAFTSKITPQSPPLFTGEPVPHMALPLAVLAMNVHIKFPLEYKGTRVEKRLDPPTIGEHTSEILKELNISDEAIKKMIAEGIIKTD